LALELGEPRKKALPITEWEGENGELKGGQETDRKRHLKKENCETTVGGKKKRR